MRNAPLVGEALRRLTPGEDVTPSVPEPTVTTAEPRCLLCPLCRCHADCRGWGGGDG
jgi:hypothetical protein